MSRSKVVVGLAVMGLLATVWVGGALSQEGGGGGGRRGRRGGGDPAQRRQRYEQRMKEQLAVTDEEWKALKPLVNKVNALSRQARTGRFRRRRRAQEGAEAPKLTGVEKAADELRKVLDNKDSEPDAIAAKLTALRDARAKAEAELGKAQDALRATLTQRQEAQMVLMGLLD